MDIAMMRITSRLKVLGGRCLAAGEAGRVSRGSSSVACYVRSRIFEMNT